MTYTNCNVAPRYIHRRYISHIFMRLIRLAEAEIVVIVCYRRVHAKCVHFFGAGTNTRPDN